VFNKKTGELDYDGYHKRARNTSEEDDADDDEHACIAEVSVLFAMFRLSYVIKGLRELRL
jgi:hypothetical protein